MTTHDAARALLEREPFDITGTTITQTSIWIDLAKASETFFGLLDFSVTTPGTPTPIRWHCQQCGWYWCTTLALGYNDMGDPPCDQCDAGCTMSAVAKCNVCGQDLEWGDNLCRHFPGGQ